MSSPMMAPDYFVSPVPLIWQIDEAGEAVVWKDTDSTALFLAHLQKICHPLNDQLKGLPSLTAIVYIVDALTKGWSSPMAEDRLLQLSTATGNHSTDSITLPLHLSDWLISLKQLDPEFRHGHQAHSAFLCELFEELPEKWLATSHSQATLALEWLDNIVGDRSNRLAIHPQHHQHAAELAIQTLEFAAMQVIDSESLRLRMQTGLDHLPAPNSLKVVEQFPLAALTAQLASEDDDLAAVAKLAQSIATMVALPRLPSDPDMLPIGGISDVTNRGPLDRLLISELAMDDDMLIARIANGQALYLRREQPPRPSTNQRGLLVEAGIRTWGTPRLHSAALALGMCLAQERRGGDPLYVVTVAGRSAWPEDFTDRAGLMRFYRRLSADIHPGEALARLAEKNELNLALDNQSILVLSEATDRDASFQRSVQDFPKPILVARVAQDGCVEIIHRSTAGDTSLQRMQLDNVQEALSRKQPEPEPLPLFLRQTPCPLRFSVQLSGLVVQLFDQDSAKVVWVLKNDRRALVLTDRDRGAIEVGYVPSGRVLATYVPDARSWWLIIEDNATKFQARSHTLVRLGIDQRVSVQALPLGDEDPEQVVYCFDRGQLIRVGQAVTFLDLRSGEVLATSPCHHPHLGGPFFGRHMIYVIDRDGSSVNWIKLNDLPFLAGVAARNPQGIPVVYSQDLSAQITLDGDDQQILTTGTKILTDRNPSILRISADRTRMLIAVQNVKASSDSQLVTTGRTPKIVQVGLTEPNVQFYLSSLTAGSLNEFDAHLQYQYQSRNTRTKLSGLSFTQGHVVIHAHGRPYRIQYELSSGSRGFKIERGRSADAQLRVFEFGKPEETDKSTPGIKLRHTRLPKGDAWLDPRGLLHLRGLDGIELSLMLCDGMLAGWSSQSGTFGSRYFCRDTQHFQPCTHAEYDWLSRFADQQILYDDGNDLASS